MLAHIFQRGMRSCLLGQLLLLFPDPPSPTTCADLVSGVEVDSMNCGVCTNCVFTSSTNRSETVLEMHGRREGSSSSRDFCWGVQEREVRNGRLVKAGDEAIWAGKEQTYRKCGDAWSLSANQRLDCYIWPSHFVDFKNSIVQITMHVHNLSSILFWLIPRIPESFVATQQIWGGRGPLRHGNTETGSLKSYTCGNRDIQKIGFLSHVKLSCMKMCSWSPIWWS